MPTIRIPTWIRYEYVTMGSPPLVRSEDKKLPSVFAYAWMEGAAAF